MVQYNYIQYKTYSIWFIRYNKLRMIKYFYLNSTEQYKTVYIVPCFLHRSLGLGEHHTNINMAFETNDMKMREKCENVNMKKCLSFIQMNVLL